MCRLYERWWRVLARGLQHDDGVRAGPGQLALPAGPAPGLLRGPAQLQLRQPAVLCRRAAPRLSACGSKDSHTQVCVSSICRPPPPSVFQSVYFFCLFVCMPVCWSACLSACLSVCLHVCLFVCMSVCLSACLSVYLFVCLSFCLPAFLSVCLYVQQGNPYSLICLSVRLSLSLVTKSMKLQVKKKKLVILINTNICHKLSNS